MSIYMGNEFIRIVIVFALLFSSFAFLQYALLNNIDMLGIWGYILLVVGVLMIYVRQRYTSVV